MPYGNSTMGWVNPWVITSLAAGAAMLIAFPFIESRVAEPMFDLSLFRNRQFAAGNVAAFLSSMARGGVMIMFIVLLQGIWLPLHGYSYDSTPFWAGIFLLPLSIGLAVTGPISGWLADKHGARVLSTVGMVLGRSNFLILYFPFRQLCLFALRSHIARHGCWFWYLLLSKYSFHNVFGSA